MYTFLALVLFLLLPLAPVVNAETTQFAFGVNGGDWTITQYRVNPETGTLRHNGHLPLHKFPAALAIDPSKRFVITVQKTTQKISVFRIDRASGLLNEIPESPFEAKAISPFSIDFHPLGRFVYIAARQGVVLGFAMDSESGVLTPLPGSPYASQLRTRTVKVHPSGRYVYAVNAYANSISAYVVDQQSGALTPVPGSPFLTGDPGSYSEKERQQMDTPKEAGGIPYRLEIHPSGRFIYVSNKAGPSLSMFRVDENSGVLTPLKGNPMDMDAQPYGVVAHPSGRYLYVTGWTIGAIWGFAVDQQTGLLTPLPKALMDSEGVNPISITFNNDGSRAYVPNVASNTITQFFVDHDSGELKRVDTMRTRNRPFELVLLEEAPVERVPPFSFIAENNLGELRALRENDDGGLSVSKASQQTTAEPSSLPTTAVVDPRGRFVYASKHVGEKKPANGIEVHRIDAAKGEVTLQPDLSLALGFTPADLAIDTSGRYLYAVNPEIQQYGLFAVDPESGALSLTNRVIPNIGLGAKALALDPVSRYSFIANAKENTVTVLSLIRMSSPAIYPYHPENYIFPVGNKPVDLAVDPEGKFLFVVNQGDNALSVFKLHVNDGLLEEVKDSPFAVGRTPQAVTIHPSGEWVYVLNAGSKNISLFRLDDNSGQITAVPMRADTGDQPVAMTISSNGRFAYVRNAGSGDLRKYTIDLKTGRLSFVGVTDVGPIVALAH